MESLRFALDQRRTIRVLLSAFLLAIVGLCIRVGCREATHEGKTAAVWFSLFCEEEWAQWLGTLNRESPSDYRATIEWLTNAPVPVDCARAFQALNAETLQVLSRTLSSSWRRGEDYERMLHRLPRMIHTWLPDPDINREQHEGRMAVRVLIKYRHQWRVEGLVTFLKRIARKHSPDDCMRVLELLERSEPALMAVVSEFRPLCSAEGEVCAVSILQRAAHRNTNTTPHAPTAAPVSPPGSNESRPVQSAAFR